MCATWKLRYIIVSNNTKSFLRKFIIINKMYHIYRIEKYKLVIRLRKSPSCVLYL